MVWARSVAVLAVVLASAVCCSARDYDNHDYYAVHLDPSVAPADLATQLGLVYDGPLAAAGDDHHVFRAGRTQSDRVGDAIDALRRRRRKRDEPADSLDSTAIDGIKFAQKQVPRQRLFKRAAIGQFPAEFDYKAQLGISDPIFKNQWHLHNKDTAGNDLNVTGVWASGITGKGATVCIVDDGLDFHSRDLAANYEPRGSFDFNDRGPDPLPRLSDDRHGTRCAGEVAAVRNDVCGIGVAYGAKVSAVRILSKPITDVDEAESVVYGLDVNDIYSCSWGPPDDGKTMDGPGLLIRRAMVRAVQQGRAGKGTIYVFAAGNGANHDDNCNFDGYTNSIYSITVGAIDKENQHPYYSERCSAQLVVTYSSGSNDAIHTTDVGTASCTTSHGGTSAAGPLAAGVYALVLEARPELTWRDLQWLTVLTAVPFYDSSTKDEWQKTPLGLFHHQFGYGKLDAYSIVERARTWKPVKKQAWFHSPWAAIFKPVPEDGDGLDVMIDVSDEDAKKANLATVEHITVTITIQHSRRGDLSVDLVSPIGVVSHLSTDRKDDDAMVGYTDWTFMSVVHWGESPVGKWRLVVRDTHPNEFNGSLESWRLNLWGEADKEDRQSLHPLPELLDDIAPTRSQFETINTTFSRPPFASPPSSSASSSSVPSSPASPTSSSPASSTSSSAAEESGTTTPAFPSFRSAHWLPGGVAIVIAFVAGVCVYLFIIRPRRAARAACQEDSRSEYEFAILPAAADVVTSDEEDMDDDDTDPDGQSAGESSKLVSGPNN